MKTSYEGCHPEIEDSLRLGEHIKCRVWDTTEETWCKRTVVAYITGFENIYRTKEFHGCSYRNARPLPKTETRVICHEAMLKALLDRGYEVDQNGDWLLKDSTGRDMLSYSFHHTSWVYCCMSPDEDYGYEDWMLEEVEI